MRIVSWNVNGIRSVHSKGYLAPVITALSPDVLCLQETKAQQHQSEVDLPEYDEYWNSAVKKGYSGTAIFMKQKPLSVHLGLPGDLVETYKLNGDRYGDPNKEGRIIATELPECFIVNSYTPNSKPDLSRLSLRYTQWDPAFLTYMKRLERGKPVVFCGDLNVAHTSEDLARPKENEGTHGFTKEEREGIDAIIAAGFVDTFRQFHQGNGQYSWWSHFGAARDRNIGWRIDYIFVSAALKGCVRDAAIHSSFFGSDHCPVSVDLELQ